MNGWTGHGLRVQGLTVRRGALTICRDIDLDVPRGEITVLLGANGAGTTTLLDAIAGVLPSAAGEIHLGGTRIDRLPPHRRAGHGLGYVEQGRSVFAGLTVAQNIAVVDGSAAASERAFDLFPRLAERRDTRAGLLSGGEQQMLVIARALASRPGILLVDQLSLGLAPQILHSLLETLSQLAQSGVGILLVEQYAEAALRVGATAHLMQQGRIEQQQACATVSAEEWLRLSRRDPGGGA